MKPAALVYLQGDVIAQRLAVAWPLVAADERARQEKLPAEWARLAGVTVYEADRAGRVLRAHGICRDDGSVDRDAENFIAASAFASVKPRAKKKPEASSTDASAAPKETTTR